MHDHAPLRILSTAERLARIADKVFDPQPSRFAVVEPAPSDKPIDHPHKIADHELDAACIYTLALESRMIRTTAKALKAYRRSHESQQKKGIAEKSWNT